MSDFEDKVNKFFDTEDDTAMFRRPVRPYTERTAEYSERANESTDADLEIRQEEDNIRRRKQIEEKIYHTANQTNTEKSGKSQKKQDGKKKSNNADQYIGSRK